MYSLNQSLYHLSKTSIVFATLLCVLCLGLNTLPVKAQAPSNRMDEFKRRIQERLANSNRSQPAEETAGVEESHFASTTGQQAADFQISGAEKKTAIVGTWLGTVGDGNKVITTYNSDGTTHGSVQTEVSLSFGEAITPTHGVWEYLGGRQFGVTALGIIYDITTGELHGFLKVRIMLTLNAAGDEMSGTDKVQFLDPAGNVVETFPSSSTPYKRIKFEPFN